MDKNVIQLKDIYYTYPRSLNFAMEGVNLSAEKGEFLAIMGENGAGKTTFCKLLNGIIPHVSAGKLTGTVMVNGVCTSQVSVPELAFKVGMVFDDPDALLFNPTVRHEVAFGLENICLPPVEIEQRVKYSLSVVGLEGFEDRIPVTLSGGEKQRLSIAAAIAMKGQILVLDEPLCRLDPQGVQEVMSVLREIKENYGITIIFVSHNSDIMAEYADKVCILRNGQIAAFDTAKSIFVNNELLEENGIEPLRNKKLEIRNKKSVNKCDILCNPAVEIKDFSFEYPNGINIKNINLSIKDNDFAAIIGFNGCGKTTLLKCISGLLSPSYGDILIRGKNTRDLSVSEISKDAGFVMQNPDTQLFTDSIFKEVAFALKNMRLSQKEIKQRVEDALVITGLTDKQDLFPQTCSRSIRTKIILTCVIAMGTRIILLDEADVGNDYRDNIKIMNLLQDLHSKGFTIIFVTHNKTLASDYAHRLIKMDRNGIVSDEEF